MTYYLKWTRKGRVPSYQGGDPIPYRKWTQPAKPILCRSGWHACRWEDALDHISQELWVCELGGEVDAADNKVVATRLRIVKSTKVDDRVLRLFAADCAERVLPLFEKKYPNDNRPRKAIETARLFAEGKANRTELQSAAANAAHAAANAANAAYAAATAAYAAAAAANAAYAASAAAYNAATAASPAAYNAANADEFFATAAERQWQTDRLLVHYLGLNPADFTHRASA